MTEVQKDSSSTALDTLPKNDVLSSDEVASESRSRKIDMWSSPVDSGDLANFMKRPIQVINVTWSGSLLALTKFDIWNLMLANTAIRNKITGFARLKADLHVRIGVSGSPFHYGRAQFSYEPCVGLSSLSGATANMTTRSQLQRIMLDPCVSTTADFLVPYVNLWPYMDLQSTSATKLGVFWLEEMNALEMVNAATPTPVTILAYAWFENVQLEMPTSSALATYVAQ